MKIFRKAKSTEAVLVADVTYESLAEELAASLRAITEASAIRRNDAHNDTVRPMDFAR